MNESVEDSPQMIEVTHTHTLRKIHTHRKRFLDRPALKKKEEKKNSDRKGSTRGRMMNEGEPKQR